MVKNSLLLNIFFCFNIFCFQTAYAQSSEQTVLYREDFNDNSLSWAMGNRGSSAVYEINNGHYFFEYIGSGLGWSTINSFPITYPSKYSIEVSLRKLYGIEAGYGLVFGGYDISNIHMFTITSNGYYRIANFIDAEFNDISGWKQNPNIKGVNTVNILRIDIDGNTATYHINDQVIEKTTISNFFGDKLGVIIYQKQKIDIDYIQVTTPFKMETENPLVTSREVAETPAEKSRPEPPKKKPGSEYYRTALIIGNSDYANAPLRNPVNDAKAMADELEKLGFEVLLYTDVDRVKMREAFRSYGDILLENRGVGLFYYAGHGLQANGVNYLVPVNADIERAYEIEDQCIKADYVLRMMEEYRNPMNVIIMDACRNNPYSRSFRDMEVGLAQPTVAPTGSIIAFATAPGKTASDGDGKNGLYTQELIKAMRHPEYSIEEVFKQVRINVSKASNGKQIPWENSSLMGDFYFIEE
jgi:hypothetical protein